MAFPPIQAGLANPHSPVKAHSRAGKDIVMEQFSLAASLTALAIATASAFQPSDLPPHAPGPANMARDKTALALAHIERGEKNEARDALEEALRADASYEPAILLMQDYRYRGPQAK
jgi:Tfp pilus assembly protein PilF